MKNEKFDNGYHHDADYWLSDEPTYKVAIFLIVQFLIIIAILPIALIAYGISRLIDKIFRRWGE